MGRRLPLALLLLALTACEDAAPGAGPALVLEVRVPAEPVRTGQGFPLAVVQRWAKRLEFPPNPPFAASALAPLVLVPEGTERSEDATHIQVVRRFRSYAFTRSDVTIAPITWAPITREIDGGPTRADESAESARTVVRVRPEVDATEPGAPEVPTELLAEPASPLPWVVAGSVLALLAGLLAWRLRRGRVPTPVPTAPTLAAPGPEALLARLAAVRHTRPEERVCALAEVLRHDLAPRFDVQAARRTSAETLHALAARGLPAQALAPLGQVLDAADGVKYALQRPSAAAAEALEAAAEACVRTALGGVR